MGRTLRTLSSSAASTAVAAAILLGTTTAPAAADTPAAVPTAAAPATTAGATAVNPDVAAAPAGQPAVAPATSPCRVTVTVIAQWSTGYGVDITVQNISSVAVQWRRLDVWFGGPVWSTQSWTAEHSRSGQQATFFPRPSGGVLAPGQTVSIGGVYAGGSPSVPTRPQVVCAPL